MTKAPKARSPSHLSARWALGLHLAFWGLITGYGITSLAVQPEYSLLSATANGLAWAVPGGLVASALAWASRRIRSKLGLVGAWAAGSLCWYGVIALTHVVSTGSAPPWSKAIVIGSFIAFVLASWSGFALGIRAMRNAEQERARVAEARLEALRWQLQPHFLFNTLNTLAGAIEEDTESALGVLEALSNLLRESLQEGEDGTVADELARVGLYMKLYRARFEAELEAEMEVDPLCRARPLPPLLLQPLVENAVVHGARDGLPVRVRIVASAWGSGTRLVVSNPGTLAAPPALRRPARHRPARHRPAQGLRNVRARLEALAPGAHEVRLHEEDGWVHVTLELMGRPS